MWKRSLLWIMTLLWAIGIFCFSAQPATQSSALSKEVTKKIVRHFSNKHATESHIEMVAKKIEHIVRKFAHVGLYMVLGVLVLFLCYSYRLRFRFFGDVPWGLSTLYAVSDEIHQCFVPGRSCQFTDVLIDSLGAGIGIIFAVVAILLFKKMRSKS